MRKLFALVLLALGALIPAQAQNVLPAGVSPLARTGGKFYATSYGTWHANIISGNTTTGSGTSIVISIPTPIADNTQLAPNILLSSSALNPILVNDNNAETVTPTSISFGGCPAGNAGFGSTTQTGCATITGTFNNTHGASATVQSGTYGLVEAINVANAAGGGVVVVDPAWTSNGGTSAMLSAAIVFPKVIVEDDRTFAVEYWTPQGGLTTLAAPTTLTAVTALPSATPVGAFGTGTYFMCISYVDIMGQEGPCSATFSQAGLATGSFIFSPPAATAGAVGYKIYISLTSGTYVLSYEVPLTSTICTLTTVTTVPACAVTNTTYGQTGSTATVTAITVNTSPIDPQVTTVSSTTVYTPNAGGRTTYSYVPGSHIGTPGLVAAFAPFTISAAPGTTVPTVVGTINLPPGFMNFQGRTLEICGYVTGTATAATIENIQFQWDSFGQNTAGKGVLVGNETTTTTFATTGHLGFCEDLQTTVAGASATAGSILSMGGFLNAAGVDLAATVAGGGNTLAAAVASLNLASEARINIIYLHTTATDGAGWTLQGLTAKVVN